MPNLVEVNYEQTAAEHEYGCAGHAGDAGAGIVVSAL